jgi:protein-S-isoprenylcysteine O-methyltransferase Ste14
MNATALALLSLNYVLIMSLPFAFFEKRDRRRAAMWWVAAAPFILLPEMIALAALGVTPAVIPAEDALGRVLSVVAVVPCAASIALVASALAANRQPLPQWHQLQDLPPTLATRGPYARIRHPFYLGYLLMFLAAVLIAPSLGVIGALTYAVVVLNYTAAREEHRICASDLGDTYRAYVSRTGRFLPARRPA